MLPPIDAHAHIDVRIAPSELHALGAVVFAVTRSLDEWEAAQPRHDQMTLWGVGCHPAVPAAATSFSEARFARALATAAFVEQALLAPTGRLLREVRRDELETPLVLAETAAPEHEGLVPVAPGLL
jgi:TatD DNase family protein